MAPEIVRKEAKPSRNTDRFSLSVLLFLILMISHPLDGKREASIKCLDEPAMRQLYGEDPLFIWDPDNASNRPQPGYHDAAEVYWNIYPSYIKDLFTQAFTVGLSNPAKRITEDQWMNAFSRLQSGIVLCQSCRAENFFDETKGKDGHVCWHCKNPIKIGSNIVLGKGKRKILIPIMEGTRLYSHHINDDFDMDTVVGEVVSNPKDPTKWGVRNKSDGNWTYIKADGSQIPVPNGKAASIAKGVQIDFGKKNGTFE